MSKLHNFYSDLKQICKAFSWVKYALDVYNKYTLDVYNIKYIIKGDKKYS